MLTTLPLLCRIPHPRDRASVAASLNNDLANWLWSAICAVTSRWGMLVNHSKTRRMLIYCSHTVEPSFPDFGLCSCLVDGSIVEIVSDLKILDVILDSKLAFEKQVRAIATCFCLEEGGYFEKDYECFQRCRCYSQMLLGIHTSWAQWAGVLSTVLHRVWMSAATSQFPPIVAWSG